MVRVTKIVAVGLVGLGFVELAFRGIDAALYAWYLLFVLWVVVLFIRFALAAVNAYKTIFAKGPDGEMTFPEFEKKWRRLVKAVIGKKTVQVARQPPAPGVKKAQAICSMTSESIRSSGRMIRSGSFSTLEVVPDGYTSTELAIRLALLPTEPPKPDQR